MFLLPPLTSQCQSVYHTSPHQHGRHLFQLLWPLFQLLWPLFQLLWHLFRLLCPLLQLLLQLHL